MKQGLCLQIVHSQDIRHRKINCPCEAARVSTMTGGLDLSFGFPRNGKIPYPHQVTWSQPINMRPVRNKGRAEKPANAQV